MRCCIGRKQNRCLQVCWITYVVFSLDFDDTFVVFFSYQCFPYGHFLCLFESCLHAQSCAVYSFNEFCDWNYRRLDAKSFQMTLIFLGCLSLFLRLLNNIIVKKQTLLTLVNKANVFYIFVPPSPARFVKLSRLWGIVRYGRCSLEPGLHN